MYAEGDEILRWSNRTLSVTRRPSRSGRFSVISESSNRLLIRTSRPSRDGTAGRRKGGTWPAGTGERRKEPARRGIMDDERFVLDERGTVYDAQGYNGDLEAGIVPLEGDERAAALQEDPNLCSGRAGGGNYTGGKVSDVSAKAGDWQSQGQTEAVTDRTCETASGSGDAQGAPGSDRADVVAADGAVHQDAVDGAEMRDGAADLGQAGIGESVPLTLTGQEPATNIQNEIDRAGMNDGGVDGGAGDRVVGGEGTIGAFEAGEVNWWMAASLRVLKSRAELWRPRISGKRG